MDLNHETAMRLWVKSFGKETKVKDFAGREIAKGAYGDRNSQYGWNVDHILPQSKGGTTADHNLVCCNIKTNDEKANKFPCFYANGKKFEIVRVQNHYEIKPVAQTPKQEKQADNELNLYDSASGVRFFKRLKGIQNKKRFVGSVLIRIEGLQNNAVVDFIEEMFSEENISYPNFNPYDKGLSPLELCILVTNYDMPQNDDISELLNRCILLNTYFSAYFRPLDYVQSYEIDFSVMSFDDKSKIYYYMTNVSKLAQIKGGLDNTLDNTLYINDLVINNTEAKEKLSETGKLQQYNYVYSQLSKNLKKEVEGR
mgnify:CR=1 FL=1